MPVFKVISEDIWRLVALVVFAATMQVVLEDSASATCGDWLAHDLQADDQAADAPTRPMPSPCRNGNCRSAPEAPLPVAPDRTFKIDQDRWGNLTAFCLRLQTNEDRLSLDEFLHSPEGLNQPLERPPRG